MLAILDAVIAPAPVKGIDFTTAHPSLRIDISQRFLESFGPGVVVYAGAERDDPAQGLVATRLIGMTPGPAAVYRTPMRSGAVRIVGAEGKRLSLVSSSGARLVFDVASQTFGP